MKVLNSLYDKNLDEILGGSTPGGSPPGIFYPTTMAEFKTALEDQSFTDKFIYCTSPISIDSNLSISAMGFNFLVFGVSFTASGDYTITFSQPADSYTVIHSARGIGLQTTNFSFPRNISFVSTNDTYMTINTGTLYQSRVNLTVAGLSFRYEKLIQTSSTLTGDIAQAIIDTTTPNASTTLSGLMSNADKTKLDSMSIQTFNGRGGAVVPQAGDYTPSLVFDNTNIYYVSTAAELKAALEDNVTKLPIFVEYPDFVIPKYIHCTSPIAVLENMSIASKSSNVHFLNDLYLVVGRDASTLTFDMSLSPGLKFYTNKLDVDGSLTINASGNQYLELNVGTYSYSAGGLVGAVTLLHESGLFEVPTGMLHIEQVITCLTAAQYDADTGYASDGYMSWEQAQALDTVFRDAVRDDIMINGKPLSSDITLTAGDVGAAPSTQKDRKGTTFVIGTSTSGHTALDCDYLCDGTADEVEINAAITALPATGGEILILDGTYNIASTINLNKINSTLRGVGSSTILKRSATGFSLLNINNTNCIVSNLQINGLGGTYTGSTNHGIFITSENAKVLFCTVKYSDGQDIYASGSNALIKGNIIDAMYLYGSNGAVTNNRIRYFTCNATTSVSSWVITFNYIDNDFSLTKIYYSSISNNIFTTAGSSGIYITGDYNVISNNSIKGKTSQGIYLYGNCNNISSNILINNAIGIELTGSSKNTIIGNLIIKGTGLASDYSGSQHTIYLSNTSCNNNFITNNSCMGKDVVVTTGCTGNTIKDNKIGGETGKYTTTIATGDWVGTSAPYTATKTITGLLATDRPHITVDYNATLATALLEKKAYACIDEVEVTANDTIVFRCFETKPTQALNIIVEVY